MSWYKEGSVNIEQGSKTVTGVGTKWTNPLIGVCAGQMLILKTANTIEICEIASVQSDTQLTLASQYSGASKKGVSYEIPTTPKVSIEALALRISEMLNYYQKQMDGWQSVLTGTGDITLTAPDGRVVTIKSQRALTDAVNNSVKTGSEFPYRGYLGTTNIGNLGGQSYGVYFQNQNSDALPERGYPVSLAGSLVVYRTNAVGPQGCVQTYTTYTGSRQFMRNYIGDAKSGYWEPWAEQITTANAIYIVESYKNGSNWYNVYSNGFIEQSGALKVNTPTKNTICGTAINLLKPMKTQNYGVTIDKVSSAGPWAQTEFSYAELYTNSFYLASYSSVTGDVWVRWTVRGY